MKLTARCPRCAGTVVAHIKLNQRGEADTILATALQIHTESCPSPPPRLTVPTPKVGAA